MDRIKARAVTMPNPLAFLHNQMQNDAGGSKAPNVRSTTTFSQRLRDPNCGDSRLLMHQKCIYERQLPGDSYITAHITRLQKGYYDSPVIHGDRVDDCRFVAINFVFHPVDTTHRFLSAAISLSVHDKSSVVDGGIPLPPQIDHPHNSRPSLSKGKRKPKFLRFAPHLLFGALSPETLDWTFNLAGSLGVSQGPASASINPSGGVKSSYKIFKMMRIQGSVRSLHSWHGHEFDVEDGSLVWTLEENQLQKSGLPREFTFVMLFTKGDAKDVEFEIDIEPVVGSWYGTYPKWWLDRIWYRPMHKEDIDIDTEIGQRFGPATKKEGFNFASLMTTFDDFVTLPGTTFTKAEPIGEAGFENPKADSSNDKSKSGRQLSASPAPVPTSSDLNVRVFLEGYRHSSPIVDPSASKIPAAASPLNKKSTSSSPSEVVISRSRNRNRSRPSSEHFPTPPPLHDLATTTSRPVSAIYEVSATPLSGRSPVPGSNPLGQRPLSAVTDISEDLFIEPLSPLSAIRGLRISKSLRHSRSRDGLKREYGVEPLRIPADRNSKQQHYFEDLQSDQEAAKYREQQESEHKEERKQSNTPRSSKQTEQQQQQQPDPQPQPRQVLRYPRRLGPQSARRERNQPEPPPQSISTNPTTMKAQDQKSDQNIPSPQKRQPPRQARNSAFINPKDLYHNRFTLAEDSPTLPPPPQPPSFPPTSYPAFAPNAATSLNSNPTYPLQPEDINDDQQQQHEQQYHIPPSAPAPPPAPSAPPNNIQSLGMDTLVQREVTNYLKNHPELYSPQSSSTSMHNSQEGLAPPPQSEPMTRSTYTQNNRPTPIPNNRPSTSAGPASASASSQTNGKSKAGPSSSNTGAHVNANANANTNFSFSSNPNGVPNQNDISNRQHKRTQSMTQASYDSRQRFSPPNDRAASQNHNSGEFIRVAMGGVGHGGWEYL